MSREQFKKCLYEVEAVGELSGKLSDLGIDTLECDELFAASNIFFSWVRSEFGKEGEDLVSWWMYEDVEKVIQEGDGTETDLENIDDLYTYLDKNYRK